MTKVCKNCNNPKILNEFYKNSRSKDGLQSDCKTCTNNRLNNWYANMSPEQRKHRRKLEKINKTNYSKKNPGYRLYSKYKITREWYESNILFGCSICGSKEELHVDHDHGCCDKASSCGMCVRGVLCPTCNRGIGQFKDNPDLLRKAIAYLEKIEHD